MGIFVLARRLYHVAIRRLLFVGVVVVAMIFVFQCYWKTYSLLDANRSSIALPDGVSTATNLMVDATFASNSKEAGLDHELEYEGGKSSRKGEILSKSFEVENHEDATNSFTQKRPKYVYDPTQKGRELDNRHNIQHPVKIRQFASEGISSKDIKVLDADLSTTDMLLTVKQSSNGSGIQSVDMDPQDDKPQLLKTPLSILNNKSMMGSSTLRSKLVLPTSITQMNSLLLHSLNSSSMRPRWSSRRDRELLSAKQEIENARVISNSSGLYAPIFWDVSKFSRLPKSQGNQ